MRYFIGKVDLRSWGDRVVEQVKANPDFNYGFNAATGEFGDLVQMWIIDPAKVERVALQNAVSSAAMLLTTECVIADTPTPDAPAAPAMPGGMWGMWWMGGMWMGM